MPVMASTAGYFTELPGVIAQAPAQNAPAVATARNGQAIGTYVTTVTHSDSARPFLLNNTSRHHCRPFSLGVTFSLLKLSPDPVPGLFFQGLVVIAARRTQRAPRHTRLCCRSAEDWLFR